MLLLCSDAPEPLLYYAFRAVLCFAVLCRLLARPLANVYNNIVAVIIIVVVVLPVCALLLPFLPEL